MTKTAVLKCEWAFEHTERWAPDPPSDRVGPGKGLSTRIYNMLPGDAGTARALVGQGTHLSERVQSLAPLGTHDLNTVMSLGGSEKRYKHFYYVLKTHVWTFQEPLSLVTTVPPGTTHRFL